MMEENFIPIIPASDTFLFFQDDSYNFEIRLDLDQNNFSIYGKNGKKLFNHDEIDKVFLQSGITSSTIIDVNQCEENLRKSVYR